MSTVLLGYLHTFFLLAMHVNSLRVCSHSEAMKGSSSLLLILSRLLASPVWAQLMLTDPTWGARSLYFQNGDLFHRVHAHSLTGVQNTNSWFEEKNFLENLWQSKHVWHTAIYLKITVQIFTIMQCNIIVIRSCNLRTASRKKSIRYNFHWRTNTLVFFYQELKIPLESRKIVLLGVFRHR